MKKSITFLCILSLLTSTHVQAEGEIIYASTDALEAIFFELHETVSELLRSPKVRNTALITGLLAGAAYVLYRNKKSETSRSPALRWTICESARPVIPTHSYLIASQANGTWRRNAIRLA